MNLADWFREKRDPSRRRRRGGGHADDRRCRVALEQLEDRFLLSYSITDLGTLGSTLSYGNAINNRGWVVGSSELPCHCASHPILWANGAMHDLGTLGGATANDAFGINDLGEVVGTTIHAFLWTRESGMMDLGFAGNAYKVNNRTEIVGKVSASSHAFLWRDGSLLDLGTLYGGVSAAYGINNSGQVVGQSSGRAFLWTEQAGMKDLGTFDGTNGGATGADAINDLGQIVGASYSSAFGTHAAYFSRFGPVDLGTLGGFSEASAVNNLGQVVGDSGGRAFLTDLYGGPMMDLNTLIPPDSGWSNLFTADGINDAGQIVGTGQLPGYDMIHAFLLTPEDDMGVALVTAAPESSGVPITTPVVADPLNAAAPLPEVVAVAAPLSEVVAVSPETTVPTASSGTALPVVQDPSATDLFFAASSPELTGLSTGWDNALAGAALG
jgi:probable HAF family extracellular repeat protein